MPCEPEPGRNRPTSLARRCHKSEGRYRRSALDRATARETGRNRPSSGRLAGRDLRRLGEPALAGSVLGAPLQGLHAAGRRERSPQGRVRQGGEGRGPQGGLSLVYYGLFHAPSPDLERIVCIALRTYGNVELETWGGFVRVQARKASGPAMTWHLPLTGRTVTA